MIQVAGVCSLTKGDSGQAEATRWNSDKKVNYEKMHRKQYT